MSPKAANYKANSIVYFKGDLNERIYLLKAGKVVLKYNDIETGQEMQDLMVYPNPVSDKVNLSMKNIEHYKMIVLYDMAGKALPITSIKKRSDRLEIDLSQLPAGPYFMRVVMDENAMAIPLIKL